MPNYTTPKGKSFFSESELDDDDLDSMMTELDGPDSVQPVKEEEPNILKRAYNYLSEPLTNAPSRIADTVAEPMMAYGESNNGILNKGALYGGAFLSSLGDVADSMTSPIDLAATFLTGGAAAAGKKGALSLAGKLNTAGRLTSALPVAHGVSEITDGNILGGGLEAGLGALGMRGQTFNPKVAQNLDEIIPSPKMPKSEILPSAQAIPEEVLPPIEALPQTPTIEPQLELPVALPEPTLPTPKVVQTLDYSPSSETRARDVLKRAGVTELDGMSNKQIIEMAEQSNPGHQKPKIKVRLDRETNTLVPDNDDPVTINVLKSVKTNKPVPQRERISPNTEVELPTPETVGYTGKNPHILAMQQSVPGGRPEEIPDVTKMQEYLSIPRAMQSMWDLSFPLRQGIGLVHTKGWWKAWPDMIKSAGDEGAYRAVMDSIAARPNFRGMKNADGSVRKSFAQEAGLAVSDLSSLSTREENLGSKLAEKWVPGLRGSNRAYTAFANKLRADTFDSLIADAERAGRNPKGDMVLAKAIADYVNNASGRGNLGKLEGSATILNNLFFSPRLMASRIQMLKPTNYMFADPFVRKQYWKSMAGIVGAYSTFTALNNAAGGETGTDDPTSSDFGRTAIGNTRFDPSGGILPYLTLFARVGKGTVDMLQGNEDGRYTGKYGSKTGTQDVGDFFGNKAAPALSNAIKFYGADKNRPYEAGDQALRMFTPIMIQDLMELLKEDPSMAPFGIAQSMIGVGTNTYEEGEPQERLLPEALDFEDFNVPRSFRR